MAAPRSLAQRLDDARAVLAAGEDVWVATAGDGPYLVPLTFAWTGEVIAFATPNSSITVANLRRDGRARLAFGEQRGVDPREWGDDYAFVVLRPRRVQAWREANELAGRTLMRDGAWLTPGPE